MKEKKPSRVETYHSPSGALHLTMVLEPEDASHVKQGLLPVMDKETAPGNTLRAWADILDAALLDAKAAMDATVASITGSSDGADQGQVQEDPPEAVDR